MRLAAMLAQLVDGEAGAEGWAKLKQMAAHDAKFTRVQKLHRERARRRSELEDQQRRADAASRTQEVRQQALHEAVARGQQLPESIAAHGAGLLQDLRMPTLADGQVIMHLARAVVRANPDVGNSPQGVRRALTLGGFIMGTLTDWERYGWHRAVKLINAIADADDSVVSSQTLARILLEYSGRDLLVLQAPLGPEGPAPKTLLVNHVAASATFSGDSDIPANLHELFSDCALPELMVDALAQTPAAPQYIVADAMRAQGAGKCIAELVHLQYDCQLLQEHIDRRFQMIEAGIITAFGAKLEMDPLQQVSMAHPAPARELAAYGSTAVWMAAGLQIGRKAAAGLPIALDGPRSVEPEAVTSFVKSADQPVPTGATEAKGPWWRFGV